jgi:hypothetical protein
MPDTQTPEQQAQTPVQPANEDYKPRFDGAVRKIEELTIANRKLNEDLAAKASELEQLRAQLGVKDAEKAAAISERDKQLQSTIQSKTTIENELNELRALKLKVETINEIGDPSLLKVVDKLPSMTDKEAMKSLFSDLSQLTKDAVLKREKELLAGYTPPANNGGKTEASLPASHDEWAKYVSSLPLGSPERDKAQNAWWDWGMKNPK